MSFSAHELATLLRTQYPPFKNVLLEAADALEGRAENDRAWAEVLRETRLRALREARKQGLSATALLGHTSERTTAAYLRDKAPDVVVGPAWRGAKK